jgi:hypothetical protein
MTDPNIHDLNMTDTEYVACLAKGYDPVLDRNIIALFKENPRYRTLTQFLEIVTKATPLTDDEWKELDIIWEKLCKEKGWSGSDLDREAIMARWR